MVSGKTAQANFEYSRVTGTVYRNPQKQPNRFAIPLGEKEFVSTVAKKIAVEINFVDSGF